MSRALDWVLCIGLGVLLGLLPAIADWMRGYM